MPFYVVLLCGCCYAQWPQPKTAMEAYRFIQNRREEAEKLWRRGDPRGIAVLQDTMRYFEQPPVPDLAAGNKYLAARKTNMDLDLAEAYAIRGADELSIRYLREVAQLAPDPGIAEFLETQKSFDHLRDQAEFAAILSSFRRYKAFWDSPVFDTSFREDLSQPEKLAGLSEFWSEVKYNFAFPDRLVALDWDKLYLNSIAPVLATKSTADYYMVLTRLCALLRDGHTNVYGPEQLDDSAKPPIRTGLVENRVIVLGVTGELSQRTGIRAGMEILTVDGTPAIEYGRSHIEPYQSSSTPQDRDLRTFSYGFLRGPSKRPVRLTLRTPEGRDFEREVPRVGFRAFPTGPAFEWRLLEQNIAYVAFSSFESDEPVKEWAKAFPAISKANDLILDLRFNGGGSSDVGYKILSYLVKEPVKTSRVIERFYIPTDRARGTFIDFKVFPPGEIEPEPSARYSKPIIVLAGPGTFSAAEDFLVAWKNAERGKVIGEPSGGSTGQPLFFHLPGGGTARVCTKHDTFPDGEEWVGKGIVPDLVVRPTVGDIQAGRDPVLEAALAELLKTTR